MSFINYIDRQINLKLVYYGAGLSGKTTNLQYIYERTNPEAKGRMISLATETERTLFFDFLPLSFGSIRGFKTRIHLYSTPGQVFYDASRKLILRGVDGVVFVVDSQAERIEANEQSLEDLRKHLLEQGYSLEKLPLVIQYNKRDLPSAVSLSELRTMFNPWDVPDFEANARTGVGVFDALKAVTKLTLNELKRDGGSASSEAPTPSDRETIASTADRTSATTRSPSTVTAPAADREAPGVPLLSQLDIPVMSISLRRLTPFQGLSPSDIASAFAGALRSKFVRQETVPFSIFALEFPKDFPLGIRAAALAIPPRELGGQEAFNALKAVSRRFGNLKVIFATDPRQAAEARAESSSESQMVAVLEPEGLKSILNEADPAVAFASAVAAQVEVTRISPYVETPGVDNDYVFFGRSEIIEDVLNGRAANYILVGGRRLGKTALLQALERRCCDTGRPAIYVTLTGDDLVPALAQVLRCEARLESIADALRRGPERLIMIDEADLFVEAERKNQYALLRQLRQLSVMRRCRFILAGFWQLYRSCRMEHQSPLLNFGRMIELGALEPEASRKLVTEPLANLGITYDSRESVEHFVHVTGGRANLLTAGCREILKGLGGERVVSRESVEAALEGSTILDALLNWEELSGDSTISRSIRLANCVDRLVVLTTVREDSFTTSTIIDRTKRYGITLAQRPLAASVTRLQLEYILSRVGSEYRYAVPRFRSHLMRQRLDDRIAEEVRRLQADFHSQEPTDEASIKQAPHRN